MSLVSVNDAVVEFASPQGKMRALDGVSLEVEPGEILAVVGESGCGKTTLARAILGLQPLHRGSISVNGKSIHGVMDRQAETIGMVWQDPFASLDPRWPVGKSALEAAELFGKKVDFDALMDEVGLSPSYKDRYPHQLSGGQRQRVAIARALALQPPLLICDEPTAALDLSIRAQILNLLKRIQKERQCSILYISHDLGTVRFLADRVAVMYVGQIVEVGHAESIFENPRHWYTSALLESTPTLETLGRIPGAPVGELPDPHNLGPGCRFAPRCPSAQPACLQATPPWVVETDRKHACLFPVSQATLTP